MMRGWVKETLPAVALGFLLAALGGMLFLVAKPGGNDDTDWPARNLRSGAGLITDYGTGCQYLRAPGGGITPRLAPTGKVICTGRMNGGGNG